MIRVFVNNKRVILVSGLCACLLLVIGFIDIRHVAYSSANGSESPKIRSIEPMYAADFSDDRVLMGASHNVFIGTVLQQTGTKERGIGPETQFSVQVVQNIKGDLSGIITVDQQGGMKDGILYVIGDDANDSNTGDAKSYLLQPNSTYVFATRYNATENWYTLNSYPTASKLITSGVIEPTALQSLIGSDPRVKELEAAYPNEILLKADIANKNARNSYISVQEEKSASSTDATLLRSDNVQVSNQPMIPQEISEPTNEPSSSI